MLNRRGVLTGLACASATLLVPGRALAETGVATVRVGQSMTA